MKTLKVWTPLLALIIIAQISGAQNDPAAGFPPFGSFQNGGFDSINRQNLNTNFAFPIVSVPGRGLNFNFSLVYDSVLWKKSGSSWAPVADGSGVPTWGWKRDLPSGRVINFSQTWTCVYWLEPDHIQMEDYSVLSYGFAYIDPTGTSHPFDFYFYSDATECGYSPLAPSPLEGDALDNSGVHYKDGLITIPSGTEFTGSQMKDASGNYSSYVYVSSTEFHWKDSLGRIVLKVKKVSNSTWEYRRLDTSGTYQLYTMTNTSFNIKTNFACSGVSEYTLNAVYLPTTIALPNGRSYTIEYEDTPNNTGYKTGRIKKVTLPTGGSYEYVYPTGSGDHNGINCSDGTIVRLTRKINEGSNQSVWDYTRTQSGSDWKTKITPPVLSYNSASNESTSTFNSSGRLTVEKFYQGTEATGTLLRTINTSWAGNGTPSSSTLILEDNSTQTKTDTTFDGYGNLTQKIEYAWGSGTPGSALRTTQITYLSSSNYTSRNIRDRSTQVLVRDGGTSGTIKSRTDISYDDSGYINTSCPTGVSQHDDTGFGCSFVYRGLPTSITTYSNASTPSGGVTSHMYYDVFGNSIKLDIGGTQQKLWTYSSATTYAYPDSVTSGPSSGSQLTTSATYNSYTGLVATTTDENNKTTSFSYDSMNRLTDIQRSDNAHVYYTFDDSALWMKVDSPVDSSQRIKQKTDFDTLSRPIKTTITDTGGTSYSIVETQYDALSRPSKTSNPHNSTAQYWTETRFDALGRPTLVIPQDGTASSNNTSYSYSGRTATITDPAGKQRKAETDALGRLTKVSEPDISNGNQLIQDTTNSYDVLDRLIGVSQGTQTRSSTYDDMGRITQQTTPEAGTWSYTYNNFNQVATRTDARGVVTTYSYDSLNRPSAISYNVGSTGVPATNTISYTYGTSSTSNNNGRLTNVTNTQVSDTLTYDSLGRVTQDSRVINSTTYTTQYAYNLAGDATQITYPSGRVVKQDFDPIGRLSKLYKDASTTYAGTFSYSPAGQVTGYTYGNGLATSMSYSGDRLQLTSLSYNFNSQYLLALSYYYKTDSSNCPNAPAGNNGQIQCVKDNSNTTLTPGASGRSVSFTYDSLNRLSSAVTSGSTQYPAWGLSWSYDRYGNRTAQSISSGCTGIACPTSSLSVSSTTNRITDSWAVYDANGNMTNDGSNTLGYDAENNMVGAANWVYIVDSAGLRPRKCTPNCTNPTSNTVYVFLGSQVIAEYDNGATVGSPTREYIYLGTKLLFKVESGTETYVLHDMFSPRVMSNSSCSIVSQTGHFPFGENWYETASNKLKFTSYQRDSETSNDYAVARSYVNRFGRFSSPDRIPGSIGDPQSLNRYAYGLNDPINLSDPSGLSPCSGDDGPNPCPLQIDGGDPFGFGCTLDGISVGCSWVSRITASDAYEHCPNDDCSLFHLPVAGNDGRLAWLWATAGGVEWHDEYGNDFEGDTELGFGYYRNSSFAFTFQPGGGTNRDLLPAALAAALEALKKDDCAKLFGNQKTRAGKFNPADVLTSLVNGGSLGSIAFEDKGSGGYVAKTFPVPIWKPFSASSVSITINSFNGPGYWNTGDTRDNAETLLHELGHAFGFLKGSGGFAISNMREIFDSQAFDKIIEKNCF